MATEMGYTQDFRKTVRYELMLGREASDAIRTRPLGFLPIGCLERHGDHLPMGLDVIKAHGVCCLAARTLGGVVFPPHFYGGIHEMTPDMIRKYTGEWGNIYTDSTAEQHLLDIIRQLEIAGIKVLVLYTGHYPVCQCDMVKRLAADLNRGDGIRVIPFAERFILDGDHAGVHETSLMLYLDRSLVDMSRIAERNYQDHHWNDGNTPEKASVKMGEEEAKAVIAHLREQIEPLLGGEAGRGGRPRGETEVRD